MQSAAVRIGKVRYKRPALGGVPGQPMASLAPPLPGMSDLTSGFAYDAATPISQEMLNWMPWLRSPDTEINFDRDRMVARARDLVRNDGWAMGAVNRVTDSAIGAQFFPVPRPNHRAIARQLGPKFDAVWASEFAGAAISEWRAWADDPARHCDATRRLTFTQIARQNFRTKMIEGDCLALLPWQPDAVGAGAARYATTIQTIDPDRLCNPNRMQDTQVRRGGVQVDGVGAAIGYHLRRGHDGDPYVNINSMTWDYFERYWPDGRPFVVHDFDGDRADQHRGIGILHGVLGRFRMLNRYDATSLQAAIIRTVLGFFITSAKDESMVGDMLTEGTGTNDQFFADLASAIYQQQPVTMGGARVPVLGPGDKVQSVGGQGQADDFATFESAIIRSISSATGQSAEEISNNFTGLNYSSFRGALLQAWRTLIRRRRDFQWGFCDPIYCAWLEEMVSQNPDVMPKGMEETEFLEHRAGFSRADWIGPGRGWVDPVKERQGEVLGLDAGFGTLEQTCADISGMHWLDVIDQREIEMNAMKARGMHQPDWAGGVNVPASVDDRKPEPQ